MGYGAMGAALDYGAQGDGATAGRCHGAVAALPGATTSQEHQLARISGLRTRSQDIQVTGHSGHRTLRSRSGHSGHRTLRIRSGHGHWISSQDDDGDGEVLTCRAHP